MEAEQPRSPDLVAPPRQPKGQHATMAQQFRVLTLATEGVVQREIARVTGLSQQTVSDICTRYQSTSNQALKVLQAASFKAAHEWVGSFSAARKRGEHRPMRDALIATGVVAPDPQAQGVTVIIGAGDVAILGPQ